MMDVSDARAPLSTVDMGNSATTVQVGGDVVYWGGGPVLTAPRKPSESQSTTGC